MPDDLDYTRLGRLTAHPEEWSADDLATAERLVADQRRAIDEEHPRDASGRQAKQDVIDGLEGAIRAYRSRAGTPE